MTADDIISALELSPHPEGGNYRQTWASSARCAGGRGAATCILFLLKAGERSHWHRVDAEEIWLHHAGAPLALSISEDDDGPARSLRLGPSIANGEAPQVIVPKNHWQSARSFGDWTLVGCVVSPAFEFDGFELAGPDFDIPVTDG